jgi:predicted secreted protein
MNAATNAWSEQLPTAVTLEVGEHRRLDLPSASGGGYQWTAEVSGTAASAELETGPVPDPGSPPSSTSAPEFLVIEARATGRVEIRLRLVRSWEPNAPLADHAMAVDIV